MALRPVEHHEQRRAPHDGRPLPVGAAATAHYDPSNPADSILEPGVRNSDAFMLLFFAPFNAVIAGGVAIGVLSIRRRQLHDSRPGGLIITEAGGVTRARLPQMVAPSIASIAFAGVLAFFAIFALAIPRLQPAHPVVVLALAASVTGGALTTPRSGHASPRAGGSCAGSRPPRAGAPSGALTPDGPRSPSLESRAWCTGRRFELRNGVKSTEAVLKANGYEYRLAERYDREESLDIGNWLLEQTGRSPDTEDASPPPPPSPIPIDRLSELRHHRGHGQRHADRRRQRRLHQRSRQPPRGLRLPRSSRSAPRSSRPRPLGDEAADTGP